jgi:hypothetical protein
MLARMSLFIKKDQQDSKHAVRNFSKKRLTKVLHGKADTDTVENLMALRLLGKNFIRTNIKQKLKTADQQWEAFLCVEETNGNLEVRKRMLEKLIYNLESISNKSQKANILLKLINEFYIPIKCKSEIAWYEKEIAKVEKVIINHQRLNVDARKELYQVAVLNEELSKRYKGLKHHDLQKTALLIASEYVKSSGFRDLSDGLEEDIKHSLNEVKKIIDRKHEAKRAYRLDL